MPYVHVTAFILFIFHLRSNLPSHHLSLLADTNYSKPNMDLGLHALCAVSADSPEQSA
jgi:hypothetical protein